MFDKKIVVNKDSLLQLDKDASYLLVLPPELDNDATRTMLAKHIPDGYNVLVLFASNTKLIEMS